MLVDQLIINFCNYKKFHKIVFHIKILLNLIAEFLCIPGICEVLLFLGFILSLEITKIAFKYIITTSTYITL